MPIWCLGLGALILTAQLIGGDSRGGAISFGVMAAAAAFFYFGERSETLRGIGGGAQDERFALIDRTALSIAGTAMALALLVAWLYELSQGHAGTAYSGIFAVGTIAYLGSIVWLRRHS
jgi:hypothetical protein